MRKIKLFISLFTHMHYIQSLYILDNISRLYNYFMDNDTVSFICWVLYKSATMLQERERDEGRGNDRVDRKASL